MIAFKEHVIKVLLSLEVRYVWILFWTLWHFPQVQKSLQGKCEDGPLHPLKQVQLQSKTGGLSSGSRLVGHPTAPHHYNPHQTPPDTLSSAPGRRQWLGSTVRRGDLALPKPCRNVDLGECCNQRALSPLFKPIMEPLPVGNQFVVISLCFGILTLLRESEGRGSWKRCFYRSALCSIMTEGLACLQSCMQHTCYWLIKLKSDYSEAGWISIMLVFTSK